MQKEKYPLPDFLREVCTPEAYRKWLRRQADRQLRQSRERANVSSRESLKVAREQGS
jgi:hypothetical protein